MRKYKNNIESFLTELENSTKTPTVENLEIMGASHFPLSNLYIIQGKLQTSYEYLRKFKSTIHIIGTTCPICFVPVGLALVLEFNLMAIVFLSLFLGLFSVSVVGVYLCRLYFYHETFYCEKIEEVNQEILQRQLKNNSPY